MPTFPLIRSFPAGVPAGPHLGPYSGTYCKSPMSLGSASRPKLDSEAKLDPLRPQSASEQIKTFSRLWTESGDYGGYKPCSTAVTGQSGWRWHGTDGCDQKRPAG